MKVVSQPPIAHTLISATRHIGYSLEAAVADLIDNSIAADARKIEIVFEDNTSNQYLSIIDDGCGMSALEITKAMRYGSADPSKQRDSKDLGRYGLGLKTASMSQCRRLTVVSKKDSALSARRWDLDYISQHKDLIWPLLELDASEVKTLPGVDRLEKCKRGTVVIWQCIDFGGAYDEKSFDDEMFMMKEHLALVFHRYLAGEEGVDKIEIKVNGSTLTPKDPFLQYAKEGKLGHQCKATQILGAGENRIILHAYTLPHDNELTSATRIALGVDGKTLKKSQGFYIYRNKRLITYGSWCGLKAQGEFFKLSRVQVDIPNTLDSQWSLDVKKSIAVPPKHIMDGLRMYVNSVVSQSKNAIRVQVLGKNAKKKSDDPQVWETKVRDNEVTAVLLNREHPIIKTALETNVISEKLLCLFERTIPVDVIYYSRSSEQKMENEQPLSVDEMVGMLSSLIQMVPMGKARKEAFRSMILCEPFALKAAELKAREEEIINATL